MQNRQRKGARAATQALLAVAWLCLIGVVLNSQGKVPFDQEPYTHAQRLVDVGNGRRLNIYCTGRGRPTVILDAGLNISGSLLTWGRVQPSIARTTPRLLVRACWSGVQRSRSVTANDGCYCHRSASPAP